MSTKLIPAVLFALLPLTTACGSDSGLGSGGSSPTESTGECSPTGSTGGSSATGDAGSEGGAPSTSARRIFISSVFYHPDFLAGMPGTFAEKKAKICQDLADKAGLTGKWHAWLSGSTNIRDEIKGNGPWVRMDGTPLLADRYDLFSGPRINVSLNEHGLPLSNSDIPEGNSAYLSVWTGTRNNGAAGYSCNDFTTVNQPGAPPGPGFVTATQGPRTELIPSRTRTREARSVALRINSPAFIASSSNDRAITIWRSSPSRGPSPARRRRAAVHCYRGRPIRRAA